MVRKGNRFEKGFAGMKGGVYICGICGKKTRSTGDNASCGLCPKCYEDCMEENRIHDGYGKKPR